MGEKLIVPMSPAANAVVAGDHGQCRDRSHTKQNAAALLNNLQIFIVTSLFVLVDSCLTEKAARLDSLKYFLSRLVTGSIKGRGVERGS